MNRKDKKRSAVLKKTHFKYQSMEYKEGTDFLNKISEESGIGIFIKQDKGKTCKDTPKYDWQDEEFLFQFRNVIGPFIETVEEEEKNTNQLRDCLCRMHDVFKKYVLPREEVFIEGNLPFHIVKILQNLRENPEVLIPALYVACDLTRGDDAYTEELLNQGFYEELVYLLRHEKSLTFKWPLLKKKQINFTDAITICLCNIYIPQKFRCVIKPEDVKVICDKRDFSPSFMTQMYIAKFLSLYTREKIDNIDVASRISHVSSFMMNIKEIVIKDSDTEEIKHKKAKNREEIMGYTGIIMCNMLRTRSIDPSIYNIEDVQEWVNQGLQNDALSVIEFLTLLAENYGDLFEAIHFDMDYIFQKAFMASDLGLRYLNLLSAMIMSVPKIVLSHPQSLEVINVLPEEMAEAPFNAKSILGRFICNFIRKATSDQLREINAAQAFAFLETLIDDSLPEEKFNNILIAVMIYHKFFDDNKLTDTELTPIFDEVIETCFDCIDNYTENNVIHDFKEMFEDDDSDGD